MVLSTGHTFGHLKRKLTLDADAPKNLFLTKETRNVLQHFSETNKTIHFECILKGLSSVKEQSYYNSRMIACNTVIFLKINITCFPIIPVPWMNFVKLPFIPSKPKHDHAHNGPQHFTNFARCIKL